MLMSFFMPFLFLSITLVWYDLNWVYALLFVEVEKLLSNLKSWEWLLLVLGQSAVGLPFA